MAREFSVIIERDSEGYYVASVAGLTRLRRLTGKNVIVALVKAGF